MSASKVLIQSVGAHLRVRPILLFVGIKGFVFRTQTGEVTVHAKEITFLSKSIRPLPIVKYKDGVAYDKFEDPELRYRQRYVDLVVNEGVKDTFLKRATIVRTMRQVFDEAGYTEVEVKKDLAGLDRVVYGIFVEEKHV